MASLGQPPRVMVASHRGQPLSLWPFITVAATRHGSQSSWPAAIPETNIPVAQLILGRNMDYMYIERGIDHVSILPLF